MHNAKILVRLDNPLTIFDNISSFSEAHFVLGLERYARPKRFFPHLENLGLLGMGGTGKVLALVLQLMMDNNLIIRFNLPISADFHYLRMMLATEAIVIPEDQQVFTAFSLTKIAQDMSLFLSDETVTDYNGEISIASYILGSRVCARHPQMTANPILPSKRRKAIGGKYTAASQLIGHSRNRELGFCEKLCPIEGYCRLIVPSGLYHTLGYLAPIDLIRPMLKSKGYI